MAIADIPPRLKRIKLHRPRQIETLHFMASRAAQNFQGVGGFDAFGHDAVAQAQAQADQGFHQAAVAVVVADVADQRAVQLYRRGGQLAQVGPVAVAGAKVVDGQVDTDQPQPLKLLANL